MKLNNVLLVYKKSIHQIYFEERKYHLESSNTFSKEDLDHYKTSDEEHRNTLKTVKHILISRGIKFKEIYRARHIEYSPYDFVISVGGDGTFIEASRMITNQFILGVNSNPSISYGNFCTCNQKTFESYIEMILNDNFKHQKINRLDLHLNNKKQDFRVINDILIAHIHPGAMSRYQLDIGSIKEKQKGAGLWISTAAGSTGAAAAAGGKILPRGSKKIQYRPRELFLGEKDRYQLKGGLINPDNSIVIQSLMREGRVYADGAHLRVAFPYGSKVTVSNSKFPLRMVV